jgi:hypothetical protein
MRRERIYSALISFSLLLSAFSFVLAHDDDKPQTKQGELKASPPAATTTTSDSQVPAIKPNPAAAFAAVVASVRTSKDAMEVELPPSAELNEFLTQPSSGRYMVRQLTVSKGDEVRALSVALHATDDIFLLRGKEVANAFEGMYYVVDRTGWLRGAAFQEGKTITQVPMGDVWQAYETEKAFWVWMAGQLTQSSPRPADAPAPR